MVRDASLLTMKPSRLALRALRPRLSAGRSARRAGKAKACPPLPSLIAAGTARARLCPPHGSQDEVHLIAKSSLVSLVPFISSRIQIGNIPRPDHFKPLFFLL